MFWWISQPDGMQATMCVDNAVVGGLGMSALPAHVIYVGWKEGRGEVERDDQPGLRAAFMDPTPYLPHLDDFLLGLTFVTPPITLDQAKKVKLDLNNLIFDAKRQAPIAYMGYTWDASDEEVAAINSLMSANLGGTTNDQLVTQINTNVVAPLNTADGSIVTQGNTNVDYNKSLVLNAVNNDTVAPLNTVITRINAKFAEYELNWGSGVPGGGWLANPSTLSSINPGAYTAAQVSQPPPATAIPAPSTATLTLPWYPLGLATPINMTFAQFSGLIDAINDRRASLSLVQRSKRAAIGACATVAAVIAIDLAAGWPT